MPLSLRSSKIEPHEYFHKALQFISLFISTSLASQTITVQFLTSCSPLVDQNHCESCSHLMLASEIMMVVFVEMISTGVCLTSTNKMRKYERLHQHHFMQSSQSAVREYSALLMMLERRVCVSV